MQAARRRRSTASIIPPATFSNHSSSEIIRLKEETEDGNQSVGSNFCDDKNNTLFREDEKERKEMQERKQRVKARQEVAVEKTLKRRGRDAIVGNDSNSVAGSAASRSSKDAKKVAQISKLKELLEKLENETPWYMQTPEEMLKIEKIKQKIEMLEEAGDACSIDSLSLSLSCRQEKSCDEKHGRRNSIKPLGGEKNRRSSVLSIKRDEDDESCVSSLSNDSYRGPRAPKNKGIAKENSDTNRYAVRSLRAKSKSYNKTSQASSVREQNCSPSPNYAVKTPDRKHEKLKVSTKLSTSTHSAGNFPPEKGPFLPNKSISRALNSKRENKEEVLDPVVASNTCLLSAATEEDISKKFLLTREIDKHIKCVEEEIRLLHAKQGHTKTLIQGILKDSDEKATKLAQTQEELITVFQASQDAVMERKMELEAMKKSNSGDLQKIREAEAEAALERERKMLCRLSVEDVERIATRKKEQLYDTELHAAAFQNKSESFLPSDEVLRNPMAVLEKYERIDHLWDKFREFAWAVGKNFVRHEAVAVMILSEAAEGGRRWAQTSIAKKLPRRALVVDLIAQKMQRARVKQAFDE